MLTIADTQIALQQRCDLLLAEEDNWAKKLGWGNDGADIYGATFWRCWLQFFFYQHFPNQWSDEAKWHNVEGVNWTGPVCATLIIGFVGISGYFFMKGERSRWIKSQLSPEFLLSFYALKKRTDTGSQKTVDAIQKLIDAHTSADEDERNRIAGIQSFFNQHEYQIDDILNAAETVEQTSSSSQISSVRTCWETGYEVLNYYSYLHWLFWMIGTLILYQSIEDYGLNPDNPHHSDAPGFFEGPKSLIYSELLAPLALSIVAAGYLFYKKYWQENSLKSHEALALKKQGKLRDYYLSQQQIDDNLIELKTYKHFTGAMISTGATTFISHFILMNIVAWPLSGFFLEIGKGNPNDPMIVPYIFIATTFAAAVQVYYRLGDMHAENKAALEHGTITVSVKKVPEDRWLCAPLYRFKNFYLDKENRHKTLYYTVGRVLGSGGILLTRILFNGGMGNFRANDGKPSLAHVDRMELLKLASVVAIAVIILNLYQYFKTSERQTVLKEAGDQQLKKACSMR